MASSKAIRNIMALMPYLMRERINQRQMEGWLQNKLKEYEAWAQTQGQMQNQSLQNALVEALFKSGITGAEDLDRPMLGAIERIKQGGIGDIAPGLRLPEPQVSYGEATKPYEDLAVDILGAKQGTRYPEAMAIINATRLKGTDFAKELLDDIAKMKKEKGEMEIREKEHEESVEGRGLRERELGVRRGELAAETSGDKTKTQLAKDVERWQKELESYVDEFSGIGKNITYKMKPEQKRGIEVKIRRVRKQIKDAEGKLGKKILPDKSDEDQLARIAKGEAEKGHTINWYAALMKGYDPEFLKRLMKELGYDWTGTKK